MTRRKEGFRAAVEGLEDRLVLTHRAAHAASVVVSGLSPSSQVLNGRQQPLIAEINQVFDSFQSDYGAARSTYFASILNVPNPDAATTNAFTLYTRQRVSLLAQQVISTFLQTPQGTVRAKGQPTVLQQLVSRKLINPTGQDPAGSLARSLLDSIPQPGTSSATASLYSLTQDNAIESARVAVINGVNIVKVGAFGNSSSHN